MTDIFIKQGGDTTDGEDENVYVVFQTEKARNLSGKSKIHLLEKIEENVAAICLWAVTHSLTINSEVKITL